MSSIALRSRGSAKTTFRESFSRLIGRTVCFLQTFSGIIWTASGSTATEEKSINGMPSWSERTFAISKSETKPISITTSPNFLLVSFCLWSAWSNCSSVRRPASQRSSPVFFTFFLIFCIATYPSLNFSHPKHFLKLESNNRYFIC